MTRPLDNTSDLTNCKHTVHDTSDSKLGLEPWVALIKLLVWTTDKKKKFIIEYANKLSCLWDSQNPSLPFHWPEPQSSSAFV